MHLQGFLLYGVAATATQTMQSHDFKITVDPDSGALLSIIHPSDNASMSWISGPSNTPWQPPSSRWGLGYADLGDLHRAFWTKPHLTTNDHSMKATYKLENLQLDVTRTLDDASGSLEECYSFTNTGTQQLSLNNAGLGSLGIYTPFNDHYTSTTDVLEHRAHAHIWANGGASSWVKMTRMGLRGPHLGLVLTEGSLGGYSVESRSTVTSSNTRGFFLLHPDVEELGGGESTRVCWRMFWHEDWEDFFAGAARLSGGFVRVEAEAWTVVVGETVKLSVTAGESVAIDGEEMEGHDGVYTTSIQADTVGERKLTLTTRQGDESSVVVNIVPDIDSIIANRVKFITTNQQLNPSFPDQSKAGAYAVYDNQMEGIVTFDTASDRNTGRERVGMGVLIARWLLNNPDDDVAHSLAIYYDYVNNRLQDPSGYVHDWPIGGAREGSERLYDWPWIMQLHLTMAKLDDKPVTSHGNYTATPSQRFLDTVESFYSEGGIEFYPINLPIYEGLTYLQRTGNKAALQRVLHLFTAHGQRIADIGENYPSSEVNYEQSIIAPAANILLELYRFTGKKSWLDAAQPHFDRLLAFGGRQPDYHLHDIAIRHWDGYWFGKDRMWGDTFPHYWSTLTGIAMHHYAKATGEEGYAARAEGVMRANLALFDEDGRGYCAFLYPVSVDGRTGHYLDPYANDQDWALAHLLLVREDA